MAHRAFSLRFPCIPAPFVSVPAASLSPLPPSSSSFHLYLLSTPFHMSRRDVTDRACVSVCVCRGWLSAQVQAPGAGNQLRRQEDQCVYPQDRAVCWTKGWSLKPFLNLQPLDSIKLLNLTPSLYYYSRPGHFCPTVDHTNKLFCIAVNFAR